MKYLLDTCVISDFLKGNENVKKRLLSEPPSNIFVSTITVMEVEYGLMLNPERTQKLQKPIALFFESVEVLPFTDSDAKESAKIRAELKKEGKPIGPYDILLAGTALNREIVFVTNNVDEFSRVMGLKVENWS